MANVFFQFSRQAFDSLADDFADIEKMMQSISLPFTPTNSVQVAWQVVALPLKPLAFETASDDELLFVFQESYSHFYLIKRYLQKPSLTMLYADFSELWFLSLFKLALLAGHIVSHEQAESMTKQFGKFTSEINMLTYCANDEYSAFKRQGLTQRLRLFMDGRRITQFDDKVMEEFTDYLNQIDSRIRDKKQNRQNGLAADKFLKDGLFRFAKGLCNAKLSHCLGENFPNPHQRKLQLRVIK